jgi:hypothetical protein
MISVGRIPGVLREPPSCLMVFVVAAVAVVGVDVAAGAAAYGAILRCAACLGREAHVFILLLDVLHVSMSGTVSQPFQQFDPPTQYSARSRTLGHICGMTEMYRRGSVSNPQRWRHDGI